MINNPSHSISIIICTWNRENSLSETLFSLNEQADCDGLDVEVIVVDNNSTDNTKSVVEEKSNNWKLGKLHYCFESRQGKQFALNFGIKVSTKDILAFTDDDILFPTDWLAKIYLSFTDSSLELAGGKTLLIWPESGMPSWYDNNMMAILGGVDLGDIKLSPSPDGYAPAGGNLIARRSLFDRVGNYSETHFRHMDYEFGVRCANQGVGIAYEPSVIVYAPVDSNCLTKRYFRRWSFKAGISGDEEKMVVGMNLLGIQLWVYRQLFEDLVHLIIGSIKNTDEAENFRRELRFWRNLGQLISQVVKRARPNYYNSWVEKYSQKRGNLY